MCVCVLINQITLLSVPTLTGLLRVPLEAPSSTKALSRAKASGSSAFKDLVTSTCPWSVSSERWWGNVCWRGTAGHGEV